MKKITLLAVAALAISFASCKKDRTCTCTVTPVSSTTNGVASTNLGSASTDVMVFTKVTKKGAACNSGESTDTYVNGASTTVTVKKSDCKLS